jgi:hypothetical protein
MRIKFIPITDGMDKDLYCIPQAKAEELFKSLKSLQQELISIKNIQKSLNSEVPRNRPLRDKKLRGGYLYRSLKKRAEKLLREFLQSEDL